MNNKHHSRSYKMSALGVLLAVTVLSVSALGQGGTDYDLSWNTTDAGGEMFTTGDEFGLSGTIGQADASSFDMPMTGGDFEVVGGFWPMAGSGSAICIVHGNPDWDREDPETHVPFDDWAFTGFIDPAVESSNGVDLDRGKTTFNLVFNVEPFGDAGGGAITASNFSVEETSAGPAPTVVTATKSGNAVSVVLSRIVTLQEWTTIVADVWSGDGVQIVDGGNEGEGVEECARMDVAFEPGDVNNDGSGQPLDLNRWINSWNAGQVHPPDVSKGAVTDYTDISRNGAMDPIDVNRLIAAFKGQSPFTRNWRNLSLNNTQP